MKRCSQRALNTINYSVVKKWSKKVVKTATYNVEAHMVHIWASNRIICMEL